MDLQRPRLGQGLPAGGVLHGRAVQLVERRELPADLARAGVEDGPEREERREALCRVGARLEPGDLLGEVLALEGHALALPVEVGGRLGRRGVRAGAGGGGAAEGSAAGVRLGAAAGAGPGPAAAAAGAIPRAPPAAAPSPPPPPPPPPPGPASANRSIGADSLILQSLPSSAAASENHSKVSSLVLNS